jgi:hypothetical protein
MSYQIIVNDSFQRSDTSFGGAANSTNVGVPDQWFSPSAGDAWIDEQGSTWAITSNALVQYTTIGGNTSLSNRIRRKQIEAELNQQLQVVMSFDGTAGTGGTGGSSQTNLLLRQQFLDGGGTKSGFYCQVQLGNIRIGWHNATTLAGIGSAVSYPANAVYAPSGSLLTNGRQYIVTFSAVSNGAGGTNLSATIQDKITTDVIATVSGNGSTASDPNVHLAGTYGISFNPILNARVKFWSVTTSYQSASNLNANQTTIQAGSQAQGIVLTGTGTNWLTSQPVFALSGAAAVSLVAGSITYQSDTQATLTVNVGAGTGQTLTITDPSQGSLNTCTISIVAASGANPAFGTGLPVPNTATTIKIYSPPPYGGIGPYTITCWRYRTTTFTNATGGAVNVSAGITYDKYGINLIDTPPDGSIYTYRFYAVDSAGSPKTGHGAAVPGIRGYAYPAITNALPGGNGVAVKVGGLGDSIYNHANPGGTLITPVGYLQQYLLNPGNAASVTYTNNAFAGMAAINFDPTSGSSPNYYASGLTAFQAAGVKYVVYTLGTNDSGANTTKANYKTYVQNYLAQLLIDMPSVKVFLNYPDLELAGDGVRNDLIIQYCDAIDEILSSGTYPNAVAGNKNIGVWFIGRADQWADSLHPSDAGASSYGYYWANSVLGYILPGIPQSSGGHKRLGLWLGIGL